ncbi:MAG: DUF488 domain-containing protein [Gammaproteobacteria bacterium]|jgi:uncharacterized protein YeaO (DUF488 family)
MEIRTKRAYEPASRDDGTRILVDGMWPRGVSKEDLAVDDWLKQAAPSAELRNWFGHDPERWEGFRERYFRELEEKTEVLKPLVETLRRGPLTLVYAARDEIHNNAVVLRDFLRRELEA